MKIDNFQRQKLKRVEIYPLPHSPHHDQMYSALYRSFSFDKISVAVSLLKGTDNIQKMINSYTFIDKYF